MATFTTDVLVIGSGAGGATTAVRLAEGGREVLVLEEGPWLDADRFEPFSLDEMVAKYRHRGVQAALGNPTIAYAEGRCVGGSTEINSGLFHRLPDYLATRWRRHYDIDEFSTASLGHYASQIEDELGVSTVPGPPPPSSAALERGATKLGWENQEFARVFRYDEQGRGTKQTMSRTLLPRAVEAGARVLPDCRVVALLRRPDGVIEGVRARQTRPDGDEEVTVWADHVFVCAGAVHTPALLQRSGVPGTLRSGRRWLTRDLGGLIGGGLKVHPHIKVAARFPEPVDHDDVAMHRVTEFAPQVTIGGSASRRGYVALALADAHRDVSGPMAEWENIAVYYAATRTEGEGRVLALPGLSSPVVTYKLTEADLSRLTQGLVHLGETLLAAGATELHPSIVGGPVARSVDDLAAWWDLTTRDRTNLMTVHLTSTVRMGQDREKTGADSFGRVWDHPNLYVNDASLIPDAPGVNPQAAIMTLASRNADHFLATT
jgi:choline dehydrogenase-like flavoprotein